MEFQIKILLLSFVATTALGIIIIPILRRLKVGQIERDDGPESHLKKQGTPTMGGIIVILATAILTATAYGYYIGDEPEVANKLLPILLISTGFGLVIYVLYLVYFLKIDTYTYIPILKTYINLWLPIYIVFNIFVILGTTNAVNLTDGVDGLATSVSVIIIACLTVIGIIYDVKEVAVFGSIVTGTCLGFLIFNLHPAKVFMGDTGSLLLGGVIAGMSIYLKMPLLLLIIAIIPVLETISVIIQVVYFKKTGNRIFKMAPLHHHFELSGWNENKVVSIFSIITLIFCVIGLYVI